MICIVGPFPAVPSCAKQYAGRRASFQWGTRVRVTATSLSRPLRRTRRTTRRHDGILFGPFYEGNKGTAIYNSSFRPFQSPVPFLFLRQGVISDWKFFLDNEDWVNRWAHRYGESGVRVLAEELRRLPWRAKRD